MRTKTYVLLTGLLLCSGLSVQAQEMGNGTYWTSATTPVSSTELPNGNMLAVASYTMDTKATDADHPLHGMNSTCVQMVVAGADEAPVSLSGSCHGSDPAGNGMYMWWRAEELGTDKCPVACGAWGIYGGHGKMGDMRGMGTFNISEQAEDGVSNGKWDGHHMMDGAKMHDEMMNGDHDKMMKMEHEMKEKMEKKKKEGRR